MNSIQRTTVRKHIKALQATLAMSACVLLIGACGSDSSTVNPSLKNPIGDDDHTPKAYPRLTVEFMNTQTSVWADVEEGSITTVDCKDLMSDYKFRLVNSGDGKLNAVGTAVEVTKTTVYNDPDNAEKFEFTVSAAPEMPVDPDSTSEFVISLASTEGCAHMGEKPGGGAKTRENALITIETDDPSNPTFSATLRVLGAC